MTLRSVSPLLVLLLVTAAHIQTAAAQAVIDWQMLHEVDYVKDDADAWVLAFSERIQQFDSTVVTIDGYILPLEQSMTQRHFILSASPLASCQYCLPGDTSVYIEVQATEAFTFSYEPVRVKGTLTLLADDPNGLLYRMTDAQPHDM